MTDFEKEFWARVYILAMRKGDAAEDAALHADEAIRLVRERKDK